MIKKLIFYQLKINTFKMYSKIKNDFKKSLFYKNYKNIDTVYLIHKKIKNQYDTSKVNFKKESISFVNKFLNVNMHQINVEKYIKYLSNKYDYNDLIKESYFKIDIKKFIDELFFQKYNYLEIFDKKMKIENYLCYLEKNYKILAKDDDNQLSLIGENSINDIIDILKGKIIEIDSNFSKYDLKIQNYYTILLKIILNITKI